MNSRLAFLALFAGVFPFQAQQVEGQAPKHASVIQTKLNIFSLQFSPDGKQLACVGYKPRLLGPFVQIWDPITGKLKYTLEGKCWFGKLAYSLNSNRFVLGEWAFYPGGNGPNAAITVWDAVDGKELYTSDDLFALSQITEIAIDPTGVLVGWFDCNSVVTILNTKTRKTVKTMRRDQERDCSSIRFSPDGKVLAFGESAKELVEYKPVTIEFVGMSTDRPSKSIRLTEAINHMVWSPTSDLLAVACHEGGIRLLSYTEGKCLMTLRGHKGGTYIVQFARKNHIVSVGKEGDVKVWCLRSTKEIASLAGPGDPWIAVALSPDGKQLAFGYKGGKVTVKDLTSLLKLPEN